MSQKIAIIDYGMGNLRSVQNALQHVSEPGDSLLLTQSSRDIAEADKVIFPGQGAARDCMHSLRSLELVDALKQAATEKPFLGICVGMQVLVDHSDENDGVDCLGIIPGNVERFPDADYQARGLKIPQMGWNQVQQSIDHALWQGIDDNSYFYFVHSYFVKPNIDCVAGYCDYGQSYAAAVASDTIFAIQSHPEKSSSQGLRLLKNFLQWNGK